MTPKEAAKQPRKGAGANGSNRRSELLAIAAQLFATRGYSQTTVRDIADEAGILSGSLYHHFDSKEAMLGEILQGFLEGLYAQYAEVVGQDVTAREKFDGLVRSSFRTMHEQQHAVALYQNEYAVTANLPGFDFVTRTSRSIEAVWLEVLEAGRQSGDFRPNLEMKIVYRLLRDAMWSTVRWYNPRGKLRHEKLAEQYLELIHSGLLA
ncbi:TetR/AcrR family transcriptional regulator [Nocardioides sp. zg-DK7169]|uniref:TetR/AcrR family transcriptional regulator n=1 Tax=Nocardioides sp. zg-DK7169 TaxID=2736600 RepID=UPI001553223A|nr:TetR/AcrR family transcriptional regulator [Nocardioides sp. zg-DK7169]NPC98644.1 TetR/AcrR family transcriptional regulator [Nocardioides sp. zg-DK7169]